MTAKPKAKDGQPENPDEPSIEAPLGKGTEASINEPPGSTIGSLVPEAPKPPDPEEPHPEPRKPGPKHDDDEDDNRGRQRRR